MSTLRIISLVILSFALDITAQAIGLDFSATQSTNNATLYWYQYTNGPVLRYDAYWCSVSNVDTGTNWVTTTNWTMFADLPPDTTNTSLALVPSNSWVTLVITVPGGLYTTPCMTNGHPYKYYNPTPNNILVTNQPPFPGP